MPDEPKRWQARIWVREKADQPVIVYGKSLPNYERQQATDLGRTRGRN